MLPIDEEEMEKKTFSSQIIFFSIPCNKYLNVTVTALLLDSTNGSSSLRKHGILCIMCRVIIMHYHLITKFQVAKK